MKKIILYYEDKILFNDQENYYSGIRQLNDNPSPDDLCNYGLSPFVLFSDYISNLGLKYEIKHINKYENNPNVSHIIPVKVFGDYYSLFSRGFSNIFYPSTLKLLYEQKIKILFQEAGEQCSLFNRNGINPSSYEVLINEIKKHNLQKDNVIWLSSNVNYKIDMLDKLEYLTYIGIDYFIHNFIISTNFEHLADIKKLKTNKFLSLNNRFRLHRLALATLMDKLDIIKDTEFSFLKKDTYDLSEITAFTDDINEEDIDKFLQKVPIYPSIKPNFYSGTDYFNPYQTELELIKNSYINIVTETHYHNDSPNQHNLFVTEKTYKPIYYMQPFIIVGQRGIIKYLKDIGFETFDNFIDETYDQLDDNKRFKFIANEITRLSEMSYTDIHSLYIKEFPKLYRNRKHLLNIAKRTVMNELNSIYKVPNIKPKTGIVKKNVSLLYVNKEKPNAHNDLSDLLINTRFNNSFNDMIQSIYPEVFFTPKHYSNYEVNEENWFVVSISWWTNYLNDHNNKNIFDYIPYEIMDLIRHGLVKLVVDYVYEGDQEDITGLSEFDALLNRLNIPKENVFFITSNLKINVKNYEFSIISIPAFWDFRLKCSKYSIETFYNDKNKQKDKVFLWYNANIRPHRLWMLILIYYYNISDKFLMSFRKLFFEDLQVDASLESIMPEAGRSQLYKKIEEITPLVLDDVSDVECPVIKDDILEHYISTYISLVSETHYLQDTLFMSEKVFKPISMGHPFIVISNHNFLAKLKEYGFKTFSDFINEDYDKEPDPYKRIIMIFEEVYRIAQLDKKELDLMVEKMQPILIHNYNHFITGFSGIVKKDLDKLFR